MVPSSYSEIDPTVRMGLEMGLDLILHYVAGKLSNL